MIYSQPLVYCRLTWQSLPVPVTALKQRLCWRNLRVFLVKYTTHLSKTSSSCFWMLSEIFPAVNLWIKISQLTSKQLQRKRLLYREHRQLHNGNRVSRNNSIGRISAKNHFLIQKWCLHMLAFFNWSFWALSPFWPIDRLKISSNGLLNLAFL